MKKIVSRSIVATVVVAALFGVLGGGSAGAVGGCVGSSMRACYDVGSGALATINAEGAEVIVAVAYNGFTGAGVFENGNPTIAFLICDSSDSTYYLRYAVNGTANTVATGVPC